MITFIPTGGLADRITTIESFISIARHLNEPKIKMIWMITDDLNSSYEDILNPIDCLVVENKIQKPIRHQFVNRIIKKIIKKIKHFFLKVNYLDLNTINTENNYQFVIDLLKKNKNFGIISGFLISKNNDFYFNLFTPIEQIQKEISVISSNFTENTIGIHIRRTDNIWSIENSPTPLFYEKMDREIEHNNNVSFYVATDSEDELQSLIYRYGVRIIYQKECIRNRSSQNGINSAVIDLFLLSLTKKIYGSFWSSFSSVASHLGNIQLLRIVK